MQRVLGSGGSRFDLEGNRGLPYDLREGIALNGSSIMYIGGPLGEQLVLLRTGD